MGMENPEAERIQAQYLERLRRMLRRAPAGVREDALREVQSHIEDEWQELGGDLPALEKALQRLGPPEAYGRDLALQLILLGGQDQRSPEMAGARLRRLGLAALFWTSTSLLGSVVVICAALVGLFGLGMLLVAIVRLAGSPAYLIRADSFQAFGTNYERLAIPPDAWSPALVALVGLLPSALIFAGLYRFYFLWVRSRLATRGLEMVSNRRPLALPRGWERQALAAMTGFAFFGAAACMIFSTISSLVPVGHPGPLSLPEDFFKTPLTFLAFLSGLVFLCAPVLGLLWAARQTRRQ